jgi:hypothetical protein
MEASPGLAVAARRIYQSLVDACIVLLLEDVRRSLGYEGLSQQQLS